MKQSVKFGIYTGLVSFVWFIAAYLLGIHNNSIWGRYVELVPFLFLIIGVTLSMRQTKAKEKNGLIDYRNSVKAGVITSSITAVVLAVLLYLYYSFINTEFVDYMVAETERYWKEKGQTEEFLREVCSPHKEAYKALMSNLVFGMFFSLIIAFFIRNIADEKSVKS